jgi:hypothetical protein
MHEQWYSADRHPQDARGVTMTMAMTKQGVTMRTGSGTCRDAVDGQLLWQPKKAQRQRTVTRYKLYQYAQQGSCGSSVQHDLSQQHNKRCLSTICMIWTFTLHLLQGGSCNHLPIDLTQATATYLSQQLSDGQLLELCRCHGGVLATSAHGGILPGGVNHQQVCTP